MKDKAYLYHILLQSRKPDPERKQITQSNQDVHVYEIWWMNWRLLLYGLSLINSFEDMSISPLFFLWTLTCPFFFFCFLFLHYSLTQQRLRVSHDNACSALGWTYGDRVQCQFYAKHTQNLNTQVAELRRKWHRLENHFKSDIGTHHIYFWFSLAF